MSSPADRFIQDIAGRLGGLSKKRLAVFFAFCAERLLPLYEAFARREGWGDTAQVQGVLDDVWRCLYGNELDCRSLKTRAATIEALTPHADDFESIETTFAQDACSCVDAAARSAAGDEVDTLSVSCVFEAIKIGITYARTGYLDLGSGEDAERLDLILASHPRMAGEFNEQLRITEVLEQSSDSDIETFRKIRDNGNGHSWRLSDILSP